MPESKQCNETVVAKRILDDNDRTRFFDIINTFPPSNPCSVDDLVHDLNNKLRSSFDTG